MQAIPRSTSSMGSLLFMNRLLSLRREVGHRSFRAATERLVITTLCVAAIAAEPLA